MRLFTCVSRFCPELRVSYDGHYSLSEGEYTVSPEYLHDYRRCLISCVFFSCRDSLKHVQMWFPGYDCSIHRVFVYYVAYSKPELNQLPGQKSITIIKLL